MVKMMKVREFRRHDNWIGYNLIVDGVEVGFAGVIEFEDCAYLERIDIYDDHMNKGYGTKFINWLAYHHDDIIAAPDNEGSQRLFDRLGWEEHSLLQGYDQGFGLYKVSSGEVDGIEFYVDHEPVEPPKPVTSTVIFDPLGKGKAKS